MSDPPPLRVDTPALKWKPAVVDVPPTPVIPAGGDPMSLMISSIMPELAAPLTAAVAETRAREERFEANLEGARTSYQTTDQAGGQDIRTVSDAQLAPASAASGAASGGSAGGQLGQMMGTAMQMAGQAVQAPMQVMGMVAAAPQAVMQGAQQAVQQINEMSGQFEKPAGQDDKNSEIPVEQHGQDNGDRDEKDEEPRSQPTNDGADAGPSSTERAPAFGESQAGEPQGPGRHRVADSADPINL